MHQHRSRTRGDGGAVTAVRRALSGVLLAAAVIIGLTSMHTMNLHGTQHPAHVPSPLDAAAASDAAGHAASASSSTAEGTGAEPGADGHSGAYRSVVASAVPAALIIPAWTAWGSPVPLPNAGTAEGSDHGSLMALLCVLALFAVFLLIVPRTGFTALPALSAVVRRRLPQVEATSRPPSLHVLCISRT